MEKTGRDVDEFLGELPEESRTDMAKLDEAISKSLPGEVRELYEGKFWGGSDQQIIGYGRTQSKRSDGNVVEYLLVGLALQKNYISIYISAVEDREYLSEKYGAGLATPDGKIKVGKSSLGFKSLDDIDLDKLSSLVKKALEVTTT